MEGCGYRDLQTEFDALGVEIVGVSFGDIDTLQDWAEDQAYLFELWNDQDKTLAVYYGAAEDSSASSPGRITVVLDEDGNQLLEYDVGLLGIGTHPEEVLADCQSLFGS
ncbi:MAG: redoxin domain-containing protein [Myxococcota bacterium]|nr:redoxin domain-containing protein [Myxococcota bacterium]